MGAIRCGPWWIAEMHGFSWLRHFKARDGRAARQHARSLINNWLKNGHDKWNIPVGRLIL